MKQLFIILLVVLLIVCAGCYSENYLDESSVSKTSDNANNQQEITTTSQNETSTAENVPTTTERSDDTTKKEPIGMETVPTKEDNEVKSDKGESQKNVSETTELHTSSRKETSSTTPKLETESQNEDSSAFSTSSDTTISQVLLATSADEKAIARKIVDYINTYRADKGVSKMTVLPGLTNYAEYRSQQLIANFAHDTNDERFAATVLKYGEYVEPSLYGMTGEPYYTANAREAIAKAGYSGSIDEVARRMSELVRNSSGHWGYVGNSEYKYIAVGITYHSGMWYCDIAVTTTNQYN